MSKRIFVHVILYCFKIRQHSIQCQANYVDFQFFFSIFNLRIKKKKNFNEEKKMFEKFESSEK